MLKSGSTTTPSRNMAAATTRRTRRGRIKKNAAPLKITIIGAGRLGTALGQALRRTGHRIELVVANHASHARRAAALIGGDVLAVSASELRSKSAARESLLRSNVIIISTPDDSLPKVAQQLAHFFRRAALGNDGIVTRVALHTSGATSSDVLAPLQSLGFAVGSLHPLVSVAKTAPASIFRGVHVCLEGDPKAMRVAKTLVRDLDAHSFTIDANRKALYHAAAVMSAGHVVALFDLAVEMLAQCGLSRATARKILLPLLNSTAENLSTSKTAEALTGPFARGDFRTAMKHLDAIKASGVEESLAVYVSLGRRALKLAGAPHNDSLPNKRIAGLLRSRA